MIVDRHEPLDLFSLVPKLRLEMEPEMAKLDRLLDDDLLFGRVRTEQIQSELDRHISACSEPHQSCLPPTGAAIPKRMSE